MMKLHTSRGTGGDVAEYVLKINNLPYQTKLVDYATLPTDPDYARLNPMRQVPALELDNGEVLTETLAICTFLCELARSSLVPAAREPVRARYLRWSTFLVASLYPTFTFGDDPSRFVTGKVAQDELRQASDAFRQRMWRQVEQAAELGGPWFLGERQTLIDVYLGVMTQWRPRMEWMLRECPQVAAIATRFRDQAPRL
jgi:GST-like protein